MHRRFPEIAHATTIVSVLIASVATVAEPPGTRPNETAAKGAHRLSVARSSQRVYSNNIATGTLFAIPRDAAMQRHIASVGDVGEATLIRLSYNDEACRNDPTSVYCNTLSPVFWKPPGSNPNILVADDIALAAVSGCELDRYVIKVTGNADGSGVGGYAVNAALYPTCPSAGDGTPIPGTECQATFQDNGIKLTTCPAPPGVLLHQNMYLGISFDRLHCGIAVGAPATKGFSADTLDFPGFECRASLGGYLPTSDFGQYGTHASFYAEIYATDGCPDAFPNYKGSMHDGLYYTPGGGIYFADDISLAQDECDMVAYEVAVKGHGVTTIDLRIALNNADPVWGGVIPGTRKIIYSDSDYAVTIGHWDFDPPIPLSTPDLWVGYKTSGAVTGPVITDRPADLGRNEKYIAVHDGSQWVFGPLADHRYAATDVTIFCADSPPVGACCDMVFTDNNVCAGGPNAGQPCGHDNDCPYGTCVGDSVCRDNLPRMNCPNGNLSDLWMRDAVCEGICDRGDNAGGSCTRQIDCPGSSCIAGPDHGQPCTSDDDCADPGECWRATCDGPFIQSCGLSACCVECSCFDLTEPQCHDAAAAIHQPPEFYRGRFCGIPICSCFFCPPGDCCTPNGGCSDERCCAAVCDEDSYCCLARWDEFCVDLATELGCCGCVSGPISWLDPVNGVIDARQPHPVDDPDIQQGITTFEVEAPPGARNLDCWTLCESNIGNRPNKISAILNNGDGTYVIHLDRPITPGAVTTITYTDDDGPAQTGVFTSHPANVNGDGYADPMDVGALIDILNGAATPQWGQYSTDCDHSGTTTPADLLCVIDLLNGADAHAPGWNLTTLPAPPVDCPRHCGGDTGAECEHQEFCKLPVGACDITNNIGLCTAIPTTCIDICAPVCGCDGETYDNSCYAHAAGVSIRHAGTCAR